MHYKKPNVFCYKLAQFVSFFVVKFIFKRKLLRNEIKNIKGPFVVIANHQAAYDFVNLIGVTKRRMSFVISNSFYQSLPIQWLLDKLAVLPKQQFQTTVSDMKRMKAVIEAGQPLVIYPAGLMCEDGLSTPIPAATYKLFKWLNVDVYMAKTQGTYFAMPKWAKGFRNGKTTLDVYKLFSKEDLNTLSSEEIKAKTNEALLFDAYREQEKLQFKYKKGDSLNGLENVLYVCPHCKKEFTIAVKDNNVIYCKDCGYSEKSDEFGFLHKISDIGKEIRYVSDWSRKIFAGEKQKLANGNDNTLTAETDIYMVNPKKKKYEPVGSGVLSLNEKEFIFNGELQGEKANFNISISSFPTLPFVPGKHIEIQEGKTIYRCVFKNGELAMKFINMVKAYFEIKNEIKA